jgi:[protein-PII] uridylyltransferase
MSSTAQKQDLSDPEVISHFATNVNNERSLTALYILTVADIAAPARGVERVEGQAPRGPLPRDAPRAPRRGRLRAFLGRGQEGGGAALLPPVRARARRHEALWGNLDDPYFQRFEANEIGWHTRTLWARVTPEAPIVRARLSPIGEGLQVMVYAPDQPGLFARITAFFERMQFDVAAAKIYTTRHGFALDNFQVLSRTRRAASTTAS